jgi:hypothetical protein
VPIERHCQPGTTYQGRFFGHLSGEEVHLQ